MTSFIPTKSMVLLGKDIADFVLGRTNIELFPMGASGGVDAWLYPLDLESQRRQPQRFFAPFDANGLPLWEAPSGEHAHNVSRIAAYALANWNAYRKVGGASAANPLTGQAALPAFILCSQWLEACPDGRFVYDFDVGDLKAPWLSCVGQGMAISVLARAYYETSEARYLERARQAALPLVKSVAEGGLVDKLPDGSLFLEEYPGSRHRHVLNGALQALMGVSDLLRVDAQDAVGLRPQFKAHLATIAANLHRWDSSGWTIYEIGPMNARARNFNTPTYQIVHIGLLTHLNRIAPNAVFADYIARWTAAYHSLPKRLRALVGKTHYRLRVGW